jgi:ABC-type arginine transport system permease subunit
VLVAQLYILILFSLFRQSIQFFSTNRCLFYIMDPLRTELTALPEILVVLNFFFSFEITCERIWKIP